MEIKGLRKIEPYVAGSQPAEKNIIKLNTNENAYGPSPAVHQALASFDAHQLRKVFDFGSSGYYVRLLSESVRCSCRSSDYWKRVRRYFINGFSSFFNSEEEFCFQI